MSDKLDIVLAQINPIVGDIAYNCGKIAEIWEKHSDTILIVFPEMAVCGYPPEDLVLKPFFIETVKSAVKDMAARCKDYKAAALIPTPWEEDGKLYNAVHLVQGGKIIETRYKYDLPNTGVFDEKRIFTAGKLPAPMTLHGHKIGVLICEDMWTSKVSTHLQDQGAELLISVNASPYETTKHNQRLELAKARTGETGLPLIYVNQCGGQDELVFDGASFVMNEGGTVILQADEFAEDIQHTVWEKTNNGHFLCATNALTPTHEGNEAIYQALVTGLRDYVTKNGFSGVIIGMSGGIDSALSAAIAVDALGADAVHCVMMPSQYTSQESLTDAEECAKALGVHYENISIKEPVAAFHKVLGHHLNDKTPATTFENIQPRARGLILMAISNGTGKMVLSTGNKSEMAVGYATLYGDMCGGFNALKDVYKTQVYALSSYRNSHKPDHCFGPQGVVIPENIITKAPTAELKDNQKDQDSLPPYEELDDILHCLIELDLSVEDIMQRGHDKDTIIRTWRMLDIAEYKRRQAPPGVKITACAFGRDRRYPITNHFKKNIAE